MAESKPMVVKPDRDYLASLYISTVLVFVVFILPWILLGLVPEFGWTYILLFLVVNALWMVPTFVLLPFYFRSIMYELKDDEIVVYKGIITRSVKVVPYRTVTNLHLTRGPIDRILGIGTLRVETAGYSGQSAPEARLVGLRDYDFVHNLVREQLRRYRAISGATTTEGAPPATTYLGSDDALAQVLAEVREIKELLKKR